MTAAVVPTVTVVVAVDPHAPGGVRVYSSAPVEVLYSGASGLPEYLMTEVNGDHVARTAALLPPSERWRVGLQVSLKSTGSDGQPQYDLSTWERQVRLPAGTSPADAQAWAVTAWENEHPDRDPGSFVTPVPAHRLDLPVSGHPVSLHAPK